MLSKEDLLSTTNTWTDCINYCKKNTFWSPTNARVEQCLIILFLELLSILFPLYTCTAASTAGVKWQGHRVNHLLPPSADTKNEWSSSSTSPIHFYNVDTNNFTFSFEMLHFNAASNAFNRNCFLPWSDITDEECQRQSLQNQECGGFGCDVVHLDTYVPQLRRNQLSPHSSKTLTLTPIHILSRPIQ